MNIRDWLDKKVGVAVYYCETYYIGNEGNSLRKGLITESRGSWKPVSWLRRELILELLSEKPCSLQDSVGGAGRISPLES